MSRPLLAALYTAAAALALPAAGAERPQGFVLLRHVVPYGAPARTTTLSAHLTYYGGRVVSNASVVEVLYGSGSYIPQITSSTAPSMASFYQQALNSAYVDWLSEYDTTGGTNQAIGRGGLTATYQITPSAANDGSTITDTQIQNELTAQLAAAHLPQPALDAHGNPDTIYMIHFPHGKSISQGGSSSCVSGGFCGYHGTFFWGSHEIYYGVLPDMQAGSGCETGCGTSLTTFGNQTSVASHELVETITDPEVGIATSNAPPLAWYDVTNGEIGDICNAADGSFLGSDGYTYVVQQEWSNLNNRCQVFAPGSAVVLQGFDAR